MTILFICLMKIKITGMHRHEILGIVLTLLVIGHLALNFNWFKNIFKKLFNKNISSKTRVSYFINIILGLLVLVIFISGILISVTIFKDISSTNRQAWAFIHRKASLIALILCLVHVYLHMNFIKSYLIRMFKCKK
nr:DUF4405 domain-containing protein [Clostridium botulinum]